MTVPSPGGFLLAGVASGDVEGDRRVVMWEGNGSTWAIIDDATRGLPAVVSELIQSDCVCGFLNNVISTDKGLLGVGQGVDQTNVMRHSSEGSDWEATTLGVGGFRGVVGVASLEKTALCGG